MRITTSRCVAFATPSVAFAAPCVAFAALVSAALLLLVPSGEARANCNLIPSAVTALGSTLGKVDRPIASPGQIVTLSLDFACRPSAAGFSPVLGNNFVRLVFQPPGFEADPTRVTDLTVAPLSVADCGPNRCSTLSFVVPDTDDLLDPVGDGRGLVGPALIVAEDVDGNVVAQIDQLYQPTLSCTDQTPDEIFERFVVLPPPNALPAASTSGQTVEVAMQAVVDAGGDLIVPIDYSAVLPSGNAGPLARILDATWDLPSFETDPTPITFPDNGFDWIRSFSDVGRAIPPFLEIEGTGGGVSGSVDAAVSVLHIQNDDGRGPIFDLVFRLIDGKGPVIINDPVQITIGGAIPLESLTTSADTAVFVVDEAAQGEDLDGNGRLDAQIVQIKNANTGQTVDTGQAVTVVTWDQLHKQALANSGDVIAFLQSEAASRVDLVTFGHESGDGDVLDDVLRVYDAFGNPLNDGFVFAADPLPRINNRSLAVTDGDLVIFGVREGDDEFHETELASLWDPTYVGDQRSYQPDVSDDGNDVAFLSASANFRPESAYVYQEQTFPASISFDGSDGFLDTTIRFLNGFSAWGYNLSSVFEVPISLQLSGGATLQNGTFDFTIGSPEIGIHVVSNGAGSYYTCAPGTWPGSCNPNSPPGAFEIGQLLIIEEIVPDANVTINTDLIGDLRARKPTNVSDWLVQFRAQVTDLDGQTFLGTSTNVSLRPIHPQVAHLYVRDRENSVLNLVSRSPFGGAPTEPVTSGSISGDARKVAYTTAADALSVEADFLGFEDVFYHDLDANQSLMVTWSFPDNQPANGDSRKAVISGDGSTIAFITQATNLFPSEPFDLNEAIDDILVYDTASRTIVDRVVGPPPPQGGFDVQPNGNVFDLQISWDGNVIAFSSNNTNLDPPSGFVPTPADVFRFDRTTRELRRITKTPTGEVSDGSSGGPSLSEDGRYLAFWSDADNLIDDGLGALPAQILVYDHETGELERVSLTTAGEPGDGSSNNPSISRDGQRVAFRSEAGNLQDEPAAEAVAQAYLYDRVTNSIDVFSIGQNGERQISSGDTEIALSGDGYTVAWNSNAPGLTSDDANGDVRDVFARGTNLLLAPDLNGNVDGGDRVLRALRIGPESPHLVPAAEVQYERASVAAGRAAILSQESALAVVAEAVQVVGVAGVVADSDGDGAGDNAGIPNIAVAGNTIGTAGQDGLSRFIAEFDLSGIDPRFVQGITLRLRTSAVGGASQDLSILRQRTPHNGVIEPNDWQRDARSAGLPTIPPTSDQFHFFDVTSIVLQDLNRGIQTYGFQGRAVNESLPPGNYTTGIRTSAATNAPGDRPMLIVELETPIGTNGDGDLTDQVVFLFDGRMEATTPFGISARDVQISDQVLCALVAEADESQDLNGDGNMDDQILFVADLSSYPPDPIDTGFEATQVVASGPYCYFTEPEREGEDRTGDGDFDDQVIVAFDVVAGQLHHLMASEDQSGSPLPMPQELAAEELVASGNWVAFRTCEAKQGRELNRDVDQQDCVMHVADVTTGVVDNTLRAAEQCTFEGCDPFFEPYRLVAQTNAETGATVVTLSFVTFEPTQGGERPGEGCLSTSPSPSCDLTTDGDDLDYVVQVYNPASRQAQAIEVSPDTTVPPFPTTTFDGDLIIIQIECEAVSLPGVECGSEGAPELVTLVVPDSDGDGTFDSATNEVGDNCENFNPDQSDGDGDGLGASCDPDTDPETGQETTTPDEELPGGEAKLCELTGDGVIDDRDVDIVFGDRGQRAAASDPRDPDRDRLVTILDARECVTRCTYPNCEQTPPSSCGLLGLEALFALVPWWIRRRKTR